MDPIASIKEAEAIAGSLTQTTKMPGFSYSIDARGCKTGSKLRQNPNSPCSKCYALKGRYVFPNVRNALSKRLEAVKHPRWVEAMTTLLRLKMKPEQVPYFRWFDSGDIQGKRHFRRIIEIAKRFPKLHFWLPTQEYEIVQGEDIPPNLVVRVSEREFGFKKTRKWKNTSSVAPKIHKDSWAEMVENNTANRWHCPSSLQNNECKSCRACWKPNIKHVVYPQH
ncbi:MAG: hypothetical protein HKM28_06950 [Flavobacteriaceae bacterium]|nr:hypothetical protein [Flavobacteriaceae bacterium]